MAPQKTMAMSQQQQQPLHQQTTQQGRTQGDQPSKSKKRKGKQQQISSNNNSVTAQQQQPKVAISEGNNKQQVTQTNTNGKSASKENLATKTLVKQPSFDTSSIAQERPSQNKLSPSVKIENTTTTSTSPLSNNIKQQQQKQNNQVPPLPAKESQNSHQTATITDNNNISASSRKQTSSVVAASATVIAKQISVDDQDEIDAGIELDGSSNSGSSVKDLNEDQIKSTSVSPIMAQSSLVNESHNSTKHAIEVAPMEQMAGSLCTDISPGKKFGLTAKQQLAANQQVIDADEQLLQQKLQSKQRKSSLQGVGGCSANLNTSGASGKINTSLNNNGNNTNALNISTGSVSIQSGAAANTSSRASLGGGGSGVPVQSPTLFRICEQHVYQMERMMAEKSVYHKSCFRCYQCKIQLRIDNYSSHEGQVYCKAHHRQIFQPQVNLDNEDDVDIVAKSNSKVVDDYLLHRGRLSDLSFSFLQPKPEGIRKRQMIICENEPAELPKDVIRSDTKLDDGIDRLNLNLGNIKERFERGAANSGEVSPSSPSAGIVIEKPSFNLKKTLLAFETKSLHSNEDEDPDFKRTEMRTERPVVKKLTNLNGFLNRQNSSNESEPTTTTAKPLAVRRSESLMMRLKKYESRIAGDQVANDDEDNSDCEEVNNNGSDGTGAANSAKKDTNVPKKLSSIDLSSLKSQWENGDISKRRFDNDDDEGGEAKAGDIEAEKNEELIRIRQQLARKRSSGGGASNIKNIYENAIKEAQTQKVPTSRLSDLSALNGLSTTEIQQQLLQNGSLSNNSSNQQSSTPSTPNKDHFQLNLSNKANKLRERFEQGLINNNSHDDSDENDGDNEPPTMTKLEQLRQEKMEDLSIFTEGEIRAREARSMFQQIDRRLSNGQHQSLPNSRSLSSISASMQAKLQMKGSNGGGSGGNNSFDGNRISNISNGSSNNHLKCDQSATTPERQNKPIRLMNNVRT